MQKIAIKVTSENVRTLTKTIEHLRELEDELYLDKMFKLDVSYAGVLENDSVQLYVFISYYLIRNIEKEIEYNSLIQELIPIREKDIERIYDNLIK